MALKKSIWYNQGHLLTYNRKEKKKKFIEQCSNIYFLLFYSWAKGFFLWSKNMPFFLFTGSPKSLLLLGFSSWWVPSRWQFSKTFIYPEINDNHANKILTEYFKLSKNVWCICTMKNAWSKIRLWVSLRWFTEKPFTA